MLRTTTLLIVLAFLGCSPTPVTKYAQDVSGADVVAIGGSRPAALILPTAAVSGEPVPLILALHGYTSHAAELDRYFDLSSRVNEGFALILADGRTDTNGDTYWNATDWCCAFAADPPADDVEYLSSLIEEAKQLIAVDRVIAVGHSNGGFMSYRLACEGAADVSTVISLAGTSFVDEADCGASEAVSVLHIHGDADDVVSFSQSEQHSGAVEEVARWAVLAGCAEAEQHEAVDLERTIPGAETLRTVYNDCSGSQRVELWTIAGGSHVPAFSPPLGDHILRWLSIDSPDKQALGH